MKPLYTEPEMKPLYTEPEISRQILSRLCLNHWQFIQFQWLQNCYCSLFQRFSITSIKSCLCTRKFKIRRLFYILDALYFYWPNQSQLSDYQRLQRLQSKFPEIIVLKLICQHFTCFQEQNNRTLFLNLTVAKMCKILLANCKITLFNRVTFQK